MKAWLDAELDVSRETMERLNQFVALLTAENEQQNLVARSTTADIWDRHILDSAQLALYLPKKIHGPIMDLGSGPGLPGIVLALLHPAPMMLIESRKRRCEFLRVAVSALDLGERVSVHFCKLQSVAPVPAGAIVARAFAPIRELLDMARPFSHAQTRWVLPRGRKAGMDYSELPHRHKQLFHVEQSLTDPDAGILVGEGAA